MGDGINLHIAADKTRLVQRVSNLMLVVIV